jgi:hypothetical protein
MEFDEQLLPAEHVFEKHFVSSFLIWVFQSGVGDCTDISNAFFEHDNIADAANSIQSLVSQLTWWSTINNEPIDNGVERFREFFILESHINQAKNWVRCRLSLASSKLETH